MAESRLCFVLLMGHRKFYDFMEKENRVAGDDEWEELSKQFTILPATRQIIVADIYKVKSSCGFGIPYYEYTGKGIMQ
jgi:hypothetical protein